MQKRPKLSDLVASGIKDYILEHELSEGDRLPTEQQMAEMFSVSRISVREATQALGFLGILRSAPRRGLTVGRVDMHRVTEYLGFHFALNNYPRQQLLKTRIVIETGALAEIAETIASHPEIFQRLSRQSESLRDVRNADEFIAGDLAFHRSLLECSGIEPLVAFSSLLEVFFGRFRQQVIEMRKLWNGGLDGHMNILAALRHRDVAKAHKLLRKHLASYQGHL